MDFLSLSLFSKPNCPKPLQKHENKTKNVFPSPGVAQINPLIGRDPPAAAEPQPRAGRNQGRACPDPALTSVRYLRQCHTLGDTGVTHRCHPLPARRDKDDELQHPRAPCSSGRLSLAGAAQGHGRSSELPLMPWKMLYGSSGRPGSNKCRFFCRSAGPITFPRVLLASAALAHGTAPHPCKRHLRDPGGSFSPMVRGKLPPG